MNPLKKLREWWRNVPRNEQRTLWIIGFSLSLFLFMHACMRKRRRRQVNISEPFPENYAVEYGKLDYTGKSVLDIGADYGSTAYFFLKRGARTVYAVEGRRILFEKLVRNSEKFQNIAPYHVMIRSVEDMTMLLHLFKPDIVKCDCEGCERFLLDVEDKFFSQPDAYIIETHTLTIERQMRRKLLTTGYQIIDVNPYCWWSFGYIKIITATK